MGLEKGNESDLNKDKNAIAPDDAAALKIQLDLMQRELAQMRAGNNPQQFSAPGGMSPDQFTQLIKAVKDAERPEQNKLTVKTFIDEKDIDPKDFDAKGVNFCACSTGYLIVDDVRQGFPVPTPFGNAIFFKFNGQVVSRDMEGKQVLNTFCSYESKSKKEQEWLRSHRYFGLKFFESAKEALSVDAMRAQKLMKYVDNLMSQDSYSIVAQAKQYNVPISEDVRTMRFLLANKMLDATEGVQESATTRILKEKLEEELFMNDPTKMSPERKNRAIS